MRGGWFSVWISQLMAIHIQSVLTIHIALHTGFLDPDAHGKLSSWMSSHCILHIHTSSHPHTNTYLNYASLMIIALRVMVLCIQAGLEYLNTLVVSAQSRGSKLNLSYHTPAWDQVSFNGLRARRWFVMWVLMKCVESLKVLWLNQIDK